jgi:hypothetical protein
LSLKRFPLGVFSKQPLAQYIQQLPQPIQVPQGSGVPGSLEAGGKSATRGSRADEGVRPTGDQVGELGQRAAGVGENDIAGGGVGAQGDA